MKENGTIESEDRLNHKTDLSGAEITHLTFKLFLTAAL